MQGGLVLFNSAGDDGTSLGLDLNGSWGPQPYSVNDFPAHPHVASRRANFQGIVDRVMAGIHDHRMAGSEAVLIRQQAKVRYEL